MLWALAVAQPLFHLLGRNPEFFATRGSPPREIVAFALVVTFAAPLAVLALEWAADRVGESVGWGVHLVCVALLIGAIALQAISQAGTLPALVLAVALGAAGAVAYVRLSAARSLLTVLGPAPLVFLALFLLVSDVSDLVFPGSADVQAAHVRATAPVVLVIFDEFPVHSLMGADGRIDKRLYPNFARLAADATWYRNTASVDQDTPYAVPAILDGRLPRQERLPVAADHPQNIFSLFGTRYELHVREDATALCAPTLCTDREQRACLGRRRARPTPTSCSRTRSRTRWSRTPTRRSRTRGWSRARASGIATCGCTTTSPTTARPASRRSCTASRAAGARGCT